MDANFSPEDLKILETDYNDMSDRSISEYDISTVHGSIRLRTGEFFTSSDTKNLKHEISELRLPS